MARTGDGMTYAAAMALQDLWNEPKKPRQKFYL
jgi:hypothetical protein